MSLIEDVARLKELEASLPEFTIDADSLLYPDGDEAVKCRPDLGNTADNWITGTDLAETLLALRNAAPAMLDVLGDFREGDASKFAVMVEWAASSDYPSEYVSCLFRYQAMAAKMVAQE